MLPISAKDFLPQQYPFQMVDTLLTVNEDLFETEFLVLQNNVMVENDVFSVGGLLENIAQTAAASTGYLHVSQNKEVPVGYIGAIKNTTIYVQPKVGNKIKTTIKTKNIIGNASIVQGEIFLENELIATCELTIFVNN